MPSCVLHKYSLNGSSLRFFSMPRCVLHKYCRPDCREPLYRGSCVFFLSLSQSQGCFSFMRGRFREAVVLVWTIPVITASRMNESVCLLKHTHTHTQTYLYSGRMAQQQCKYSTVKYISVCVCMFVAGSVTVHAWWGHCFPIQQNSPCGSAACLLSLSC